MTRRRLVRLCFAIAFAAGAPAVTACVLAEPPADLPPVVRHRPIILRQLVTPPITQLLMEWPTTFYVPVEVDDPAASVQWHGFVDYDNIHPPTLYSGQVDPQAGDDAGVRLIPANLGTPDPAACHTVEIIVASGFVENHTPDSLGGDSVTWFYSPTGSLDGCPIAKLTPLDGGADAGDAGLE